MKVIILAAGIGKRLGDFSNDLPKCLQEVGGASLLNRHITCLNDYQINKIVIVTGYRNEMIDQALSTAECNTNIETIYNPQFESGSVISLWSAREVLCSGEDIVLMDADVLYHQKILDVLIKSEKPNCFLLDRDFEPGDEPVKLCIKNNVPVDFRKIIDKEVVYDYQGESVGFFRFSTGMAAEIAAVTQSYIDCHRGDEPYEEVIRDLLLKKNNSFGFEDISGLPWIEIDFPGDLERARNETLDAINSMTTD